jgi:tetratricopeptide (TPR) repeat protein
LYPIVLAPLVWIFSDIVIPSKVLTIILAAVLVLLFYLWAARHAGRVPALAGSFFLAFNPLTMVLSSQILSDIPFTVAVVTLFLIAERMEEAPENRWLAWGFVATLTAAVFLREVGLMLLASAAVYLFLRKRYFALLLVCSVPVLFYLGWYYRNEVYIAGIESPPLRNAKLLLGHSVTPEDSGLFAEFLARIRINLIVYMNLAKGLFLFPQFLLRPFPVVLASDAPMAVMARLLAYGQYPLIVLQYGLLVWGILLRRRDSNSLLIALFFLFYFSLIMIYPINDVRFLYPVLVPALFFIVVAGSDLYRRLKKHWTFGISMAHATAAVCILCALPDFTWMSDFVLHGRTYLQRTDTPSKPYIPPLRTPELYMRPVSLAGRWIAEHSDSSTIVLARWKELAFWLHGRKVLDYDPSISFSVFEAILRDYNVGYIVSFVIYPGIREFEFQMMKSKRFAFQSVFRVGNYEVVQVVEREKRPGIAANPPRTTPMPPIVINDRERTSRELFADGIEALERHRPKDGFDTFSVLTEASGSAAYLAAFRGIAMSFGGQFDRALSYFSRFAHEEQAGQFLMDARLHSTLIREFQRAEREPLPAEKARILHRISANYWEMGFRDRAQAVLQQSLRADSTFSPSMIFGLYYALEREDLAGARSYLSLMEKLSPPHPMLNVVRRIVSLADSAQLTAAAATRARYELELAQAYAVLGLNDLAIECALRVVGVEDRNVRALEVLAQSYDVKRRYWPERQVLRQILELEPQNGVAREKLDALERLQ